MAWAGATPVLGGLARPETRSAPPALRGSLPPTHVPSASGKSSEKGIDHE